jgi:hypothetical protein
MSAFQRIASKSKNMRTLSPKTRTFVAMGPANRNLSNAQSLLLG